MIGEKSMKNEEYKKLSIKEFTKAAGRYEITMLAFTKCARKISIAKSLYVFAR